ncbi:MAG: uracil-DNA glycosylase [Hyphomicrobiales bacterium]|nr:MAG: uracil-DNA glycosylase [Hyphomicrobiales bacterium]
MALAPTPDLRDALIALIDWHVESGVDLALDAAPHDRYADSARGPQAAGLPAPALAPGPAPAEPVSEPAAPRRLAPVIAAPDEAARAAEAEAAAAQDLGALAARLAAFPYAPFREMAEHFLFAAGTPGAPLMALDAAPGATEESSGEAFSGDKARLLDNMLAAIGQSRESAYLAYVAPWRPAGDRALTAQEIAVFAPFARRHLELARPRVVLLFGEAPARVALETGEPVSRLRGKPFDLAGGTRAFVFSGLDTLLKSPALKPAAWRDLRAAAALLQG